MKNSGGTKQAKTSRIAARPKAVLQAKNPGLERGQIAVNAEYLERIKVLSEESEIETMTSVRGSRVTLQKTSMML
jgi:hypothetical protein